MELDFEYPLRGFNAPIGDPSQPCNSVVACNCEEGRPIFQVTLKVV